MNAAVLSQRSDNGDVLTVTVSGDWLLDAPLPRVDPVLERLRQTPPPARLLLRADGLGRWDTALVATLVTICRAARRHGLSADTAGLPDGAQQLIALAFAVKEREDARRGVTQPGFLEQVGLDFLQVAASCRDLVTFTGEVMLSFGRFLRGRASYLRSDLKLFIQEAGAQALPIVSLISLLIGMIFAFVGVMELKNFGAGIYTANLVAVAMLREMAPIMTAIIMAGRTGAAYAAQIGTMKVNEEIDALTTLGLQPIDFLVTPRIMALITMMPLLSLYASLLGILGGLAVSLVMLDVNLLQYLQQTRSSVDLSDLFGGLFKSIVYGSLVAMAGCQQGIACGNSAMAVGQSTTRAVVMGIVLIVVSASVLTVIYINLGI